jgi:carboxypeptidase Q
MQIVTSWQEPAFAFVVPFIHQFKEILFMKHTVVVLLFLVSCLSLAQAQEERIDSATVARIKEEGYKDSQVMDLLSTLCDVYGPRLAWSPEYRQAADWASGKLKEWGLQNVRYDNWAPLGKGWTLKYFSADVTSPKAFPVIAYPAAWSPGFKQKEADVVYLDVKKMEDFDNYKGKLKGKYVLISNPAELRPHFEPLAHRLVDSILLRMANADVQGFRRGGGPRRAGGFPRNITLQNIDSVLAAMRQTNPNVDSAALVQVLRQQQANQQQQQVNQRKLEFALKEGAISAITLGRGDGGNLLVQSATVPLPADAQPAQPGQAAQRVTIYDAKAPEVIPQIAFATEHYNRIVRMIQKGQRVRLDMRLDVTFTKADSGFNIIAEIPGSDLKDEIVQVGGHFDSWHGGTGATDDGSGTVASMEAMRILQVMGQKYGMKPRRTIRIGLWGAEEEGLIGSRQYVSEVYGQRETTGGQQQFGGFGGGGGPLKTTPEYDKFSVYFNHDNGTGRFRGVYLQGNEAARSIFRSWFTAFGDPTAQTITIQNTGGTDHQSFDGINLPGFQFIQDPIDYDSRTHHYTMDVYERIQEDDMKQAASIMAFFAYQAATRDAKFPRKALPQSTGARAGL